MVSALGSAGSWSSPWNRGPSPNRARAADPPATQGSERDQRAPEVDAIVLFNAHRTHWIDAVPGRPSSVLFAASFDFQNTWPSCCLVERRIRSAIVSLWLDRPRKPRRRRRQPQPVAWSTPYTSHAISARQ